MNGHSTKMNFALIGAAGFIAPRHMKAISDVGHEIVVILDPCDSVGIIDNYFPHADFFTETERFDRHLDKLRRQGDKKVHYVSICSPNYLHDAHIRLALRNQAHAICEKPLVLNPWNADALEEIERETGKDVFVILQLRLHPVIAALKKEIAENNTAGKHDVVLTYITSRGNWYYRSWKGDINKSGGIATNIGIHFFDVLIDIFGEPVRSEVHYSSVSTLAGLLELKKAHVRWFLSLDGDMLPGNAKNECQRTYRSITVDGRELEFSQGFTDLHTVSYRKIMAGEGFRIKDAKAGIRVVHEIRHAGTAGMKGDFHPFLKKTR